MKKKRNWHCRSPHTWGVSKDDSSEKTHDEDQNKVSTNGKGFATGIAPSMLWVVSGITGLAGICIVSKKHKK